MRKWNFALPLFAAQHSLILEFKQNQFQKAFRYALAIRNFRNQQGPLAVLLTQDEQGLQRVFGPVRKHLD